MTLYANMPHNMAFTRAEAEPPKVTRDGMFTGSPPKSVNGKIKEESAAA